MPTKLESGEKIEIAKELGKSVDKLLKNWSDLNENQIIGFLEKDKQLSALPLKIRSAILESILASQAKLEGRGKKEEKETRKPIGRDPRKFFKELFDWIKDSGEGGYPDRKDWDWGISDDNRFVDMETSGEEIDSKFIDKRVKEMDIDFEDGETGISELLKKLKGKKIVSIYVEDGDDWYLEIID